MLCSIDGDTGLRCGGVPLNSAHLDTMFSSYLATINPIIFDGGATCSPSAWVTDFSNMIDYADYINTSSTNFINDIVADTINAMVTHALINGCSFYRPNPPQASLAQRFKTIATNIITTCTETCIDTVYIGTGAMQTCDSLTTLNATRRQASIHTVDFTCIADPAFT